MATKVRIEWIKVSELGVPATVISTTSVTASATPILSSAAPDFSAYGLNADNHSGFARLTVLSSSAIITWGDTPTASEGGGIRAEVGQTFLIQIRKNQLVSVLEAADAPVIVGGGGGGGGAVTQSGSWTVTASGLAATDGTPSGNPVYIAAQANASTPTRVEGKIAPLSVDLHGSTRTTILDASGTAIDWSSAGPVTQSGTWTVQPGNTANTTPWLITSAGGTASGSSLTANPLTKGGLAKTANPTAVADGQVVNSLHDKLGKQVTVSALRNLKGKQHTTITASTSETTIVAAGAANVFRDMYRLVITNSSTTTATNVSIRDATAGSIIAVYAVPAGATVGFSTDAGSADVQTTAANNWTAQCSVSVSSIDITVSYVENL